MDSATAAAAVSTPLRRHPALEELSGNVRSLRAEVHGRPSLLDRRASGQYRRARSMDRLLRPKDYYHYDAADATTSTTTAGDDDDDDDDDDDEHGHGQNDDNDPADEGAGLTSRRTASARSFASEGRGRGGVCRGDFNDSLVIEGGEFLSTLVDNDDHSSRRGDHDSRGDSDNDDGDNDDDGRDEDSLVESILLLPSDAARTCVDAFHDFVSALYRLRDCSEMPAPLVDAIVEYSPAVNAAFGRVKRPISELELEHDAVTTTYDGSGSNDDGEGRVTKLAAALSEVSLRMNAASEAVRVIAEEFGSNDEYGGWSGSKLGESSLDIQQVLGSSSLGRSFGAGSTLGGGGFGGSGSTARSHMMGSSSVLGCSTSSTSTSSGGRSKKRLDQNAGRRFRLLECRLATCVEILTLSASEAHRIDAGFDDVDVEGAQKYGVSNTCLRAWRRAGRREEARLIEAAAAAAAAMGAADNRSPHHGGGEGRGAKTPPPKSCSVSAELFLEVASLVLTTAAPTTGTDDGKNNRAVVAAMKGGKRSSFASLLSVPEDVLRDAPCLIDRIKQDGVATAAAALGGGDELDLAEVLGRLGRIRTGMGEHAVALVHHKEAHRLIKARLGDAHPRVASTLRLIGDAYWKMGRKAAADKCYSEAADILERNPPAASATMGDDRRSGEEESSRDAAERAELLSSVFLSWSDLKLDMHDDIAALDVLSRCYAAQLKAAAVVAALASNDQAASAAVASASSEILYRRGSLCMGRHREDDALTDFDEVLRLRISSRGVDHPSVGDIAHVVGVLQSKRGNHYLALPLLEDALRIRRKTSTMASSTSGGGKRHDASRRREGAAKAADSLVVIGNIYANTGKPANAIGVYEEALELRMEGLGKGDERVADVHVNLGHAMYELRRYEDAAGHYRAGLLVIEKARGRSDGRVPRLLRFLGKAQYRAGRLRMAKMTFEELANYHKTPAAADEDEFDAASSKSGAEAASGGPEYAEAKRMVDTIGAEIARTRARGTGGASSAAPAAVVISRREQQKRKIVGARSKSERNQSASPRWLNLFGGRGERGAKVSADAGKTGPSLLPPMPSPVLSPASASASSSPDNHDSAPSSLTPETSSWLGRGVGKMFSISETTSASSSSSEAMTASFRNKNLAGRRGSMCSPLPPPTTTSVPGGAGPRMGGVQRQPSRTVISAQQLCDKKTSGQIEAVDMLWASVDLAGGASFMPPELQESSATLDSETSC